MNIRSTFNLTDDQRPDPMHRYDMWDKMASDKRLAAETAKYGDGPRPIYQMTYDEYVANQHMFPSVLVESNHDSSGNCIQSFRDVSSSPHGPIICQRNIGRTPTAYFSQRLARY